MSVRTVGEMATNCPTHFLWVGRWIPVVAVTVDVGNGPEPAWEFSSDNPNDVSDWLMWPE